jgi:hypothetical protein
MPQGEHAGKAQVMSHCLRLSLGMQTFRDSAFKERPEQWELALTHAEPSVCCLDNEHGNVAPQDALVVICLAHHDAETQRSIKGQPAEQWPAVKKVSASHQQSFRLAVRRSTRDTCMTMSAMP